ncbi:60S ribosomal export protein NMD3 [Thermococcus sp.]|uniref:60S ribosomal export protein NMD3 n=1 Tax=Thermococcus sp. TaxID=35749 RepID=UPI0026285E7F|nr:60S ribosomal export protein NMD3 [Thermococcus sp.]
MTERFCYRCGISEEEGGPLIEGLCQVCFRKENPLLLLEEEVNTELCQNCGSYRKHGTWVDPETYELEALIFEVAGNALIEAIERLLREKVRHYKILSMDELGVITELPVGEAVVAFEPLEWHIEYFPAIVTYKVRLKARIHELQRELHDEEKHVTVYVRQTICPRCSRFLGGYFEAILQVRAEGRPLTKAERKEVEDIVGQKIDEIMRKDRMGFIQDTIEKEEGLDFYMGSKGSARKLAQAIRDRFGGTINEAYELVGIDRQTSKEVYRTSVRVRIPKFQRGDVVSDRHGKVYLVEYVDGRGIELRDLETQERGRMDWKTARRDGLREIEYETEEAMVTSIGRDEVQFMDMRTYETFEMGKPNVEIEEGEVYVLIRTGSRRYVEGKKDVE